MPSPVVLDGDVQRLRARAAETENPFMLILGQTEPSAHGFGPDALAPEVVLHAEELGERRLRRALLLDQARKPAVTHDRAPPRRLPRRHNHESPVRESPDVPG